MTAQLTNIREHDGVQAVFCFGAGQAPAIVTKNYRQIGLSLPLYQSHGVASKRFIELAGDAAEGVLLPASSLLVADLLPDSDPQHAAVTGYKRAYEQRWDEQVSAFGGNAYDALHLVVDAVERAGSLEGTALRKALESVTAVPATNGVFTMSESDHNGLEFTSLRMLGIRNGEWMLVDSSTNHADFE